MVHVEFPPDVQERVHRVLAEAARRLLADDGPNEVDGQPIGKVEVPGPASPTPGSDHDAGDGGAD